MATDLLQETQSPPQPRPAQQRSGRPRSSRGRPWRRTLFAVGVLAALAFAVALIPGAFSSPETGPKLTHTIARCDLVVTVTEQGMLESSENTEIICKVRGRNTVIWVIDSGTEVKPGDVLVRLDSLFIEEQISERSKYAHWSRSSAERSMANVARAELAIPEYEQGRFRAQLMLLEKDLAIAESNLSTAKNTLSHAELMASRGYLSDLKLDEARFAVTRANLDLEGEQTELEVLKEFTKAEQMKILEGNFKAAQANHKANAERAFADASRRDRAKEELPHCIVKAERSGMVIHPSAAQWENAPRIAEGSTVYKDQVLLLMPDLSKMQVKVGINEAIIDQVKPGLAARVTLPDRVIESRVTSVATVTQPAGWWNGNEVNYDTIIELPSVEGLRPGMSAEVEVIMARHENVLTIPVAAVVEKEDGDFCWVETATGTVRRRLRLGDSNDVFTVVVAGLEEGDEVVLNPLAFEEPQSEALEPLGEAKPREPDSSETGAKPKPQESSSDKPASNSEQPAKKKAAP